MPKKRLGRGLDALIPDRVVDKRDTVLHVDIDQIQPNPDQPRQHFDPSALQELADSIATHGVIQPLIVTTNPQGGYTIIAGERRFQASQLAGQSTVPVIVRDVTTQQNVELALIENVQRQDLNSVEEAKAYRRLIDEFNLTLKEVGTRVGKSVPTISNKIRLLSLPEAVLEGLTNGKISEGHARALLSLEDPERIVLAYGQQLREKWSVRTLEKRVAQSTPSSARRHSNSQPSQDWYDAERRLQSRLGTRVEIQEKQGKGEVKIAFYSTEELEQLIEALSHVE